mmetsp:Transcript_30285/g.60814  ORF Transcript_30285/g.60814 Transcript_30285/m.60814 type:complete len:205 (+) Transcript_30285:1927-2541(+)
MIQRVRWSERYRTGHSPPSPKAMRSSYLSTEWIWKSMSSSSSQLMQSQSSTQTLRWTLQYLTSMRRCREHARPSWKRVLGKRLRWLQRSSEPGKQQRLRRRRRRRRPRRRPRPRPQRRRLHRVQRRGKVQQRRYLQSPVPGLTSAPCECACLTGPRSHVDLRRLLRFSSFARGLRRQVLQSAQWLPSRLCPTTRPSEDQQRTAP